MRNLASSLLLLMLAATAAFSQTGTTSTDAKRMHKPIVITKSVDAKGQAPESTEAETQKSTLDGSSKDAAKSKTSPEIKPRDAASGRASGKREAATGKATGKAVAPRDAASGMATGK